MKWFVIIDGDNPIRQVQSIEGEDVEGKTVICADRRGDMECERFDVASKRWVADLDALKAVAIRTIDLTREQMQQRAVTPGSAKAMIYAQKASEAALYYRLGADRVDEMPADERQRQFPAACADAQITGDSLAVVIARISDAILSTSLYRIDALATSAKRMIRAATDAAAIAEARDVAWPEQE